MIDIDSGKDLICKELNDIGNCKVAKQRNCLLSNKILKCCILCKNNKYEHNGICETACTNDFWNFVNSYNRNERSR